MDPQQIGNAVNWPLTQAALRRDPKTRKVPSRGGDAPLGSSDPVLIVHEAKIDLRSWSQVKLV
jgi:hypothetical protein